MISVSVLGASGYTGGELLRWLHGHPGVRIAHLGAHTRSGEAVEAVWPHMRSLSSAELAAPDPRRVAEDSDLVFLALPSGASMDVVPTLLEAGTRVVDLGADFRLTDAGSYERWYGHEHTAPKLLAEAVYGLPEMFCEAIRGARLVANPGCYPTATALALFPLQREGLIQGAVVVDAKSGVSGAGRTPSLHTSFSEVDGNVRPYSVGEHRHTPEIEQTLSGQGAPIRLFFVPHLIPMTRGVLASCYVRLNGEMRQQEILDLYGATYASSPFVRVMEELPQTKATLASNFCDVTVRVDARTGQATAIAAIDNLVKGAAGQAIQNMNLMFGLPETEGLWTVPVFP